MLLRLIARNAMRHKLRTILTIIGIGVAVMAFGLIRTVIDAWHAGVEASAPDRLITRNAVSIIFTLPLSYRDQLAKVDGVKRVTYANWFGGVYQDPDNFFAQFAVETDSYFDVFPEFQIDPEAMTKFKENPRAVIVGKKLADRFKWQVGTQVPITGTVYYGAHEFEVVGIYTGREPTVDESTMFMRWEYLDEWVKKNWPGYPSEIGWFALQLEDPDRSAEISAAVDAHFKNSSAETLTETEKAFQQSFVAMSGAILLLMTIMSWLIIGVILMVLINTMAMTARERTTEYAYMKSMGFRGSHFFGIIFGEATIIAIAGGALGIVILLGMVSLVKAGLSQWFPSFDIQTLTFVLVVAIALAIGAISAIFPAQKAIRMRIVDGLRTID